MKNLRITAINLLMVFMIISCNETDFRTSAFSDTTPPDEVTLFNLDAAGTNKIAVTFSNPKQTDLLGILLVRWTNEISWTPVKNTHYSNGQDLGDGLTVISTNKMTYSDRENALIDIGLIETNTYYYKAFTYDTRTNYSDGVSASANPGPYAVGWIGGGVDGWQTGDGSTAGNSLGYMNGPLGVVVDNEGNIYVAEYYNNRVSKWDKNGNAIGWIGCGFTNWQQGDQTISGNGLNYFYRPYGMYIAPSGNLYIADNGNARISKWDKNGNALGWIGGGFTGWQTGNGATLGNQYNYFSNPQGIYLDSFWNILVSDTGLNRISKWSSAGAAQGWIGGGINGWQVIVGSVAEQDYRSFYYPSGIGIDSSGNIYIADDYNNRISKWRNNDGVSQGWLGWTATSWEILNVPADQTKGGGTINNPKSVYIYSSKYIYATDMGPKRIVRWNLDGTGFLWFGGGINGWRFGGDILSGNDYRSFRSPWFITADTNGNIYISDHGNHRIVKWRLY